MTYALIGIIALVIGAFIGVLIGGGIVYTAFLSGTLFVKDSDAEHGYVIKFDDLETIADKEYVLFKVERNS